MALITLNKLALPTGSVLQVVSSTKTDDFSMTGQTWTDTGLSVDITPSSTSSKILITGFASLNADSSASLAQYRLYRNDTTALSIADTSGGRLTTTSFSYAGDTGLSVENTFFTLGINFLDTPSTTSSTNYAIYIRSTGGSNTSRMNKTLSDRNTATVDPRATSTITAIEIKG